MAQRIFPHGAPVSFYEIPVKDIEINWFVKFHPAMICFVAARGRQSWDFKLWILDICTSIPSESTMLITNMKKLFAYLLRLKS